MEIKHLFGLIGFPLTHSFSKGYFADKFKKGGLADHFYDNFPLAHINSVQALIENHPNLKGFNVTIPYKEQILPYLDEIDSAAEAIGAVNTVKITNGLLKGYNTDAYGFEQSLRPFLKENQNYQALILGTGGAAKAVDYVFQQLGITFFYVSRHKKEEVFTYEEIAVQGLADYHIIVNTTPLGMYPKVDQAPNLPYEQLNNQHLLYDLTYNPPKTVFLKNGAQQNAQIKNGLEMLHLQAEKAWEIWNAPD